MVMDYEGFKKEIFKLTGIDLGSYKEKQMKRRLDSLIAKIISAAIKHTLKLLKQIKNFSMNLSTI